MSIKSFLMIRIGGERCLQCVTHLSFSFSCILALCMLLLGQPVDSFGGVRSARERTAQFLSLVNEDLPLLDLILSARVGQTGAKPAL